MSDAITLLSPHGLIATKTVYPDRSEPAPPAAWHRGLVAPVTDLLTFVNALRTLAEQPNWYLVRGEPREGVELQNMRRTHVEPGATLIERPRRWVLLDLDKVMLDVKPADFAADPRKYAIQARDLLPPCFRTVTCWYQATGSAGVKPGARLRLGFWLDRPVSSGEWRQWTEGWDVEVDRSLFTPSQPHYTAAPVFKDGATDPVVGPRFGVLEGATEEVPVPVMVSDRPALDAAAAALTAAARRLAKTAEGERNIALNRIAFALGKRFHEDDLPAAKIEATLIQATAAWGQDIPDHHTTDTLARAVRDGRAKREQEHDGWRDSLMRDPAKDEVKATAANVSIYLEHHPAFAGKLAMEQGAAVWVSPPPWRTEAGVHTAADTTHAVEWFSTSAKLDVKPGWVDAGVHKGAALHQVNALTHWLETLPPWDRAARAETLFIRYLGAEDTAYTRAAARVWFLQARGRAHATLEQPYKADHTIVLQGPQGVGKSTVLAGLVPAPRYFLDHLPDLRDKDARLALARAWIVELAELTQRTADKDVFKAFLTSTVDSVRRPYGKDVVDVPRRCVFAASTNEDDFLTDPTGARRFLPISCPGSGLPAHQIGAMVAAERDQLWAEVMSWPEDELPILPADVAGAAQEAREAVRSKSAAEELLRDVLVKPASPMHMEWQAGDLTETRHVRSLTVQQAANLIDWKIQRTNDLKLVREALGCLGWKLWRGTGGRGTRKYRAPADWAYEGATSSAARPN
jgi:hypothetical protein